jgi:hypothetical protein
VMMAQKCLGLITFYIPLVSVALLKTLQCWMILYYLNCTSVHVPFGTLMANGYDTSCHSSIEIL